MGLKNLMRLKNPMGLKNPMRLHFQVIQKFGVLRSQRFLSRNFPRNICPGNKRSRDLLPIPDPDKALIKCSFRLILFNFRTKYEWAMPVVEIEPSLRLLFPKLVQRLLYEDLIATPTTEHPSTGETPVLQSNTPDAAFLLHLLGFFTDFKILNWYVRKLFKNIVMAFRIKCFWLLRILAYVISGEHAQSAANVNHMFHS